MCRIIYVGQLWCCQHSEGVQSSGHNSFTTPADFHYEQMMWGQCDWVQHHAGSTLSTLSELLCGPFIVVMPPAVMPAVGINSNRIHTKEACGRDGLRKFFSHRCRDDLKKHGNCNCHEKMQYWRWRWRRKRVFEPFLWIQGYTEKREEAKDQEGKH